MEAIISHIKIWGIVGVAQATVAMDDFGTEAQIIMHLSAAVASLSIAWAIVNLWLIVEWQSSSLSFDDEPQPSGTQMLAKAMRPPPEAPQIPTSY